MANKDHLEILKKGVRAWNQWRKDKYGLRPDLRNSDLNSAKLFDADMSCADLSSAKLSGADLSSAKLSDAILSGAILSGANLSGANLLDADLSTANLSGANLSGAIVSGANLSRANLFDADLSSANLSSANLSGANLSSANLSGANLSGAILIVTKLIGAKLIGANLSRANLSGADLSGANLSGANVTSTTFGLTILADVDLSDARGLDTVNHERRSSLGLDTFFNSNGNIPEVFLKGVGAPDVFIRYASSLVGRPFEFYSCFISYSHADKRFARRLHDALQGQGIRCWLDEKQLLPGDHIHQAVDEGVRLWDKVLLCCSNTSLNSWWVDKEVQKALAKEERLWKERGKQVLAIIPLNLDGFMFSPSWQDWKNEHLKSRLAADFTCWEKDDAKFDAQFESVVQALRADKEARQAPPTPRL
jgi:uncharacterized protein YjbI with pentapeptide repeats